MSLIDELNQLDASPDKIDIARCEKCAKDVLTKLIKSTKQKVIDGEVSYSREVKASVNLLHITSGLNEKQRQKVYKLLEQYAKEEGFSSLYVEDDDGYMMARGRIYLGRKE